MLSSSCRRTAVPSLAALYSSSSKSASVVVRTFTTTSSSTEVVTASTLANKKKQHQLFLLNRCTMAATTTSSRGAKQPATAATAATVQPQAANIQQPGSRNFHSYSSSSSSPSWRRTFTTSSTQAEQQSQQQHQVKNKKRTFLEWYEGHLQARPVVTKMFTGSLLWGIGDAVAQIVPQVAYNDDEEENKKQEKEQSPSSPAAAAVPDSSTASSSKLSSLTYDWPRTGRAALFGFALHAPTSHVHFNFLEWLTHRVGVTGNIRIPIFKAFMEQFVYWSWISNSMYHGAMGAMQGMTLQQIYDRIADVLWETQKAQWVFWIPVQLLNFRYVPVRHQLNVVLVTSIVWTALLSAWYPPKDDDKKEDEEKKTLENMDDATITTTADAAKA